MAYRQDKGKKLSANGRPQKGPTFVCLRAQPIPLASERLIIFHSTSRTGEETHSIRTIRHFKRWREQIISPAADKRIFTADEV